MSYSIGQVASTLGVSIDTLRYYDKSVCCRSLNAARTDADNLPKTTSI
nr:MerR family DNA-binding transcriptional regulator [Secundilactobacillus paracollinoides]